MVYSKDRVAESVSKSNGAKQQELQDFFRLSMGVSQQFRGWARVSRKFWVKLIRRSSICLLNELGCFGGVGRAIFQVKRTERQKLRFFMTFSGCKPMISEVGLGSRKYSGRNFSGGPSMAY